MSSDVATQAERLRGSEPLPLLLRPEEAADVIRVSRAKFYTLMSEGRIKSLKVGRARRIPVSEIQKWIASELKEQNPY